MAYNSRLDTSILALEANRVKNSWVTSSYVRSLKGSIDANNHCATPLSDIGNITTNCVPSNLCALRDKAIEKRASSLKRK